MVEWLESSFTVGFKYRSRDRISRERCLVGSYQSFVQTPEQCRKLSHDRFLLHSFQSSANLSSRHSILMPSATKSVVKKNGNYLHGTGYSLRSPLATNSRYLVEPERHLPCSRQPATCPYPVPDESNPMPSHQVSFKSILILSQVSSPSFRSSNQNPVCTSLPCLPHTPPI